MGTVSKESQGESESVGVFEETTAHARAEQTDMRAEKCRCEIKLDCALYDSDRELENSDSKVSSAEVDDPQSGEGATSNEAVVEIMSGETESESKCSRTADNEHRATENISSVVPTTVEYVSRLQVDESYQLETVKAKCSGDDPVQRDILPTIVERDPISQENSCAVVQSELRGRSIGCAVQCSLLPSQNPSFMMSEKSTQTHTIVHTDTAVQVTMDGPCNPEDPKCSTVTEDCNHIERTANACVNGQQMETTDDVFALRRELDSLQNTVIWQALMLRMYGMH